MYIDRSACENVGLLFVKHIKYSANYGMWNIIIALKNKNMCAYMCFPEYFF